LLAPSVGVIDGSGQAMWIVRYGPIPQPLSGVREKLPPCSTDVPVGSVEFLALEVV